MSKNKALELSIKIAGKVDNSLTAAINQSNTLLGSLTTTMSRVGTVGLAAMGALATGTVAALAKCTDAAAELETSMAPVVRYVDGLADANANIDAESYKAMKTYIQDLSTEIPRTTDSIAAMSAALGQSGKGLEEQLSTSILKDTAVAATAMDLDDQTAGNYMAKWEEAFGYSHDQVMALMNQINYLGANYATTAAEIAESVNAAGSMGELAGVDTSATAAIAAAMQAMGVSSDRVGTSVKRIYTNITKGASATDAQQEAMEKLGFTATGLAKAMQSDGTGTLLKVFEAVNNLPEAEKLSTLNTLFGQWAIEGGAKITQNLDLLTEMLNKLGDESLWEGSMEREFIIQASTSESIDTMMSNAKTALMQDVGEAFLPVKKQFSLMMIDVFNNIRHNMPELEALGESLATVLSNGVTALGDAIQTALPYIRNGLDYLANNGPQVANVLKIMAGTFAAMKFAPGIANLLGGAGNLLFGKKTTTAWGATQTKGGLVNGLKSLFTGGQRAGGLAANIASEIGSNGLWTSLVRAKNTFFNTKGKGLANGASGLLSYFGNVKSSTGTFAKSLGLDKAGSFLGGAFKDIFSTLGSSIVSTPQAQAVMGAGSFLKNGALGLAGKAGGTVSGLLGSVVNSSAGTALGGILSSGAGMLGTIWGPIASGFGSLMAGAVPVVGAISAVIAVVSLLWDNMDGLRGVIEKVFGDKGVAVFDTFKNKVDGALGFITGLFEDGGVATALSGLRDKLFGEGGLFAGNEGGMAAFDGLVSILQSVMGVAGQVVNFATGTVKPIIQDIFGYLKDTVFPVILNLFTQAAPYISTIISGIGSAVMTGMQIIGLAVQTVLPIVKGLINVILSIATVAVPAVLSGISVLAEGIRSVTEAIKQIFGGVIEFVTGVFTLNWQQAWQGVKDIFGGIFVGLEALFKTPVNAVIALINKAISGINGLGLDIPDWVPLIGGKKFSINIPEIPMLAKGGFTNGPSIAGEAGQEAVISFQSSERARNIATWMKAGELLGMNTALMNTGNVAELKQIEPDGGGGDEWNITFAPQITIQGNADRETIDEALREARAQFEAWFEEMMRRKKRVAY